MKRNKQSGFSLIELLIVVAILMIIAAIAIPKMLSARASAAEANAASTMRSLNTALTQALVKWNAFPADLGVLGGDCTSAIPTATTMCLLDDKIATALKAGTYNNYTWTYTIPSTGGFTLVAVPLASATGVIRQYFLSQDGTIHYSDDKATPPDATTPVLGN